MALYDTKYKTIAKWLPKVPVGANLVSFTATDKNMAVGCLNGVIRLYNMADKNVFETYPTPDSSKPTSMTSHPLEQNAVAVGTDDGAAIVWDIGI